jgi:putative hemolysin
MIVALAAIIAIFVYASAYIVSLYALAVYIDPDEVRTLIPGASRKHRALLMKLAADPRAFVQVSTIYRSFALIVLTVCALLIVENLIVRPAADYVFPVSLLIIWLLFIFFAEYLPRRSSRRAVNRRMTRYLWLITTLYVIFYPLVLVYRRALARSNREYQVTEEEKEEIVERAIETLAEQAGISEAIVEEDEKEMIGHIFLLDQTVVREIMSPRIDLVGIEKSTPFTEIQAMVRREGYSRYPVFEETIDRIIGILYVKDLFSNMPRLGEEFVIADYLREPFFVPESKVIGDLLREFRTRKLHVAMVVDEYGGVAGLVTLEDILEEIVGDIQDEHDIARIEYKRLADGRFLIDANMRVERLQELLHTDYDTDEHDTVGGLIYHLVGSVPEEGVEVRWHGIRLEVSRVEGQRIKTIKAGVIKSNP